SAHRPRSRRPPPPPAEPDAEERSGKTLSTDRLTGSKPASRRTASTPARESRGHTGRSPSAGLPWIPPYRAIRTPATAAEHWRPNARRRVSMSRCSFHLQTTRFARRHDRMLIHGRTPGGAHLEDARVPHLQQEHKLPLALGEVRLKNRHAIVVQSPPRKECLPRIGRAPDLVPRIA